MQLIGVGLDAVDLDRFRATLARTPGLEQRLFTEGERLYAQLRADPTERLAARFAAKEAVLKALGHGIGACAFRDIEVVRAESGQPALRLHASATALAARHGVTAWQLSLTHTATVAQAIVVALG